MPDFSLFTDRSRKVMQLANQEAQRFNHEKIDTPHVLIALLKEGSGVAANVLKSLDVDLRKLRIEVERVLPGIPLDEGGVLGRLPMTEAANAVMGMSVEESMSLKHRYVGTEHILLALLRDEKCVGILGAFDLNHMKVRNEVLSLLGITRDEEKNPQANLDWIEFERDRLVLKFVGEWTIKQWYGPRCSSFEKDCVVCRMYSHLDALLVNPFQKEE